MPQEIALFHNPRKIVSSKTPHFFIFRHLSFLRKGQMTQSHPQLVNDAIYVVVGHIAVNDRSKSIKELRKKCVVCISRNPFGVAASAIFKDFALSQCVFKNMRWKSGQSGHIDSVWLWGRPRPKSVEKSNLFFRWLLLVTDFAIVNQTILRNKSVKFLGKCDGIMHIPYAPI
jgi:hypothetical protein